MTQNFHILKCGLQIEKWFTGKNVGKTISKNVISKYSQKFLDHAKQSATDALKLLQKERFKKQQKQLVIWLVIKSLTKL